MFSLLVRRNRTGAPARDHWPLGALSRVARLPLPGVWPPLLWPALV